MLTDAYVYSMLSSCEKKNLSYFFDMRYAPYYMINVIYKQSRHVKENGVCS